MKGVAIYHDPFARYELMRRVEGQGECYWCGTMKRLFRYGIWKDGISTGTVWDDHRFCSKSCRDAWL